MIKHTTLIELLTKVAIASQGEKHLRVNSFAVVDTFKAINQVNAGRGVKDANKGYYWSRYGVTVNDDKKSYPTLILLKRRLNKKGNDKCYEYAIGVAVPEVCKPCGKNFGKLDAEYHAERLMCNVIDVLCEFKKYEVIIDGIKQIIICHPSELDCIEVDEVRGECGSMKDHFSKEANITTSGYGMDQVQLSSAVITICDCEKPDLSSEFDFCKEEKGVKPTGIVKCDTCF